LKFLTNNLVLTIFPFLFLSGCDNKINENVGDENVNEKISENKFINHLDTISIIGVGDIMMGTTYPIKTLPPDDGKELFSDVKNYLLDADITFGNLEGPLLTKGGAPKICDSGSNCIAFRMPEHYAAYLKETGFDILSIANNHANDMGKEGRISTQKTLDKYEIGYAGQIDCPTYIFEKRGITYGFAAFSSNANTCDINNLDKAVEIVHTLKDRADIVIISFHGGAEGTSNQHVKGDNEYFLNEDRGNVFKFSHTVIDAGADIVFGHGPHVSRAIEVYNKKFIAYSLGNFCTYSKFGLQGVLGIAPIMKVYVDKTGNFQRGEIIPVKQIKRGIPVYDENKEVIKIIRELTKIDFTDSDIKIDDEGNIRLVE
jgi:hypothetical protein